MFWKKWLSEYFSFSRKDRIGIMALLVMILLFFFLPLLFREGPASGTKIFPVDPLSPASEESFTRTSVKEYSKAEENFKPELFFFDPNSITAVEWKRLGLPEKTTRTIINYRDKGGRFYKPEDLLKVWGMPEAFYNRVKSHIRITLPENIKPIAEKPSYIKPPKKEIKAVSINEADSALLEQLPGIGPRLSSRIVKYRERIGGFHSIDQLAEVYGLADSVLQKAKSFLILTGEIKKININIATRDELKAHPYFTWSLANAIVEYRKQHGNFTSIETLKKIALVDEEVYQKLLPYIRVD
jgi:competence protein ComEA